MATLMLGTLTVQVAAGRIPMRYEDTAIYRRRGDGSMDVEVPDGFGRVRVWSPETIPLSVAAAQTLVNALMAAGTQSISGTAADSMAATCYVRNVVRRRLRMSDQRVIVGFELAEVSA